MRVRAPEYSDAETGFVYLRARHYDPATGQFLSRDPLVAMTQQPYAYVEGNPLNLVDPLGLAPWDWAADAARSTRAFLHDHTELMHFVINVGVSQRERRRRRSVPEPQALAASCSPARPRVWCSARWLTPLVRWRLARKSLLASPSAGLLLRRGPAHRAGSIEVRGDVALEQEDRCAPSQIDQALEG